MSFLQRLFGASNQREAAAPLYRAIVARGREPSWYRDGQVPDTVDGRFDMIAAILALVLIRLEGDGEAGRMPTILLTESFVEDMDASLRQIGIGDYVVGKHVGRMMGALGGRLTAFREAAAGGGLDEAVRRNIFHDAPPGDDALAFVTRGLSAFAAALPATELESLLVGNLP